MLTLVSICISFEREMCQILAMTLAKKLEEKEEAIRAGTRKVDEKKRLKAEKKVKRTRDKTEKENAKRYLEEIQFILND